MVEKRRTVICSRVFRLHKEQQPSFFARKKEKEEYKNRLNEMTDQLRKNK